MISMIVSRSYLQVAELQTVGGAGRLIRHGYADWLTQLGLGKSTKKKVGKKYLALGNRGRFESNLRVRRSCQSYQRSATPRSTKRSVLLVASAGFRRNKQDSENCLNT